MQAAITDNLDALRAFTQFSAAELTLSLAAAFLAGLVRGFAGFALSALVMSATAFLIAPIELIPVCFLLEAVAGVIMFRGGIREADMGIAWGLVFGSLIGVPIGLSATLAMPVALSKQVALAAILLLAAAQLLRASPSFLATRPGLYGTGLLAGIATGLAQIGGMVVALYVLAREAPARKMRASLVMYLFLSMFTSAVYQIGFGILEEQAFARAAVMAVPLIAGLAIGMAAFRPELERFYKRFCLVLLIGLSAAGLARLVLP